MAKTVRVTLTETYIYDVEITVEDNENIREAIMDIDLLIDKDREFAEQLRNEDNLYVETNYEYDGMEDEQW